MSFTFICRVLPAALFSLYCESAEVPTLQAGEMVYRGYYTRGAEVHTFTPCKSDKTYWVSFDWAGREMSDYYKSNVSKPYEPMFIEFRGHLLNEQVDGFALEYDGLIRISEVKTFGFGEGNQCDA
ncbi:hypothetical protein GZ77_00395 [Endozoicomonas montiporae]|uniref:NlpE C-terminal OB domain-containing protein n=2 Tax=Endozoicomonas montiporae TaxID=1027273 RepID=A0A081N9S2_9GAMM|nr:hypothetical protein [Endozoicomonas montiporae]AMO55052.1 hypothetical protein EZMO1_0827 [Endozoicomonas montiporae CL-33]KEQ15195.1 hypothetical protein GZ77_00395 [Endozoicomonas montiporae]